MLLQELDAEYILPAETDSEDEIIRPQSESILDTSVAGCPGPLPFWPPIYYTHRVSIKLLYNFCVSVKVNHSTLVYIVYYNIQLLALIILYTNV